MVCQNTVGVRRFEGMSARLVGDQLEAILEDVAPAGIKIGMVSRAEVVDVVASVVERIRDAHGCPVVFDPVLASSAHQSLMMPGTLVAMRERLIPQVDVLTPNINEAAILLDRMIATRADAEQAAVDLIARGCNAVLLKAGHLPREAEGMRDVLATAQSVCTLSALEPIDEDVRGTGCQLSSALTAALAGGLEVDAACEEARSYLNRLLHHNRRHIGRGRAVVVRVDSGGACRRSTKTS